MAYTAYRGAIKLQRDRAFSEFYSRSGVPNQYLAKAQKNLGMTTTGQTFAQANVSPTAGQQVYITDGASGHVNGDVIAAGGGTTPYLIWYNGTAWTVVGH